MNDIASIFHFDEGRPSFEDAGVTNGVTHWQDSVLRDALGYQSDESFQRAVLRAKQACLTAGVDTEEHFVRQPDGTAIFTRFACYLIAMNGDPKKREVAEAQAYFAALATTIHQKLSDAEGIERVLIRSEITAGQKALSSTAQRHGVQSFPFFLNAGYRGMYNMSLKKLCQHKGLPEGEQILDRMGRQEMAANLFRITQTDAKIKNENIRGQQKLEEAAETVGRKIRKMMSDTSGTTPESLPLDENVQEVRKRIKGAGKHLQGIDKKKATKKKRKP